jgi:hypothetical protein
MPNHHVMMFHALAPISAARPLARHDLRIGEARRDRARDGGRDGADEVGAATMILSDGERRSTTVAIEFAASWKPLM